jgi:hypothetical protein
MHLLRILLAVAAYGSAALLPRYLHRGLQQLQLLIQIGYQSQTDSGTSDFGAFVLFRARAHDGPSPSFADVCVIFSHALRP